MKRKTLFSLGTITMAVAPVIFVASCGSSWQKWNKNISQSSPTQDPKISNFPSVDNKTSGTVVKQEPAMSDIATLPEQHATGHMSDLAPAYSKTIVQSAGSSTTTIDINLDSSKKTITNQFQLNMILIDALNLKPVNNESVSDYWKREDWTKLSDYFTRIETKAIVNIKYKGKTLMLNWDCGDQVVGTKTIQGVKSKVIDSLKDITDSTPKSLVQLEQDPTLYNSSQGLTTSGFRGVAYAGGALVNNPLVSAALEIDSDYVMNNLTLLTNLPEETFNGVASFLNLISNFVTQIWNLDGANEFANTDVIKPWASDNNVIKGLFINNVWQQFTSPQNIIGASFLLQALSNKYAEVN